VTTLPLPVLTSVYSLAAAVIVSLTLTCGVASPLRKETTHSRKSMWFGSIALTAFSSLSYSARSLTCSLSVGSLRRLYPATHVLSL
jgi:hypothetical protein